MYSTRPNCRVYQKASFTTNLPSAPDKIITVVVKALLLPKMTVTGVMALSWGKEMLLILRLHPQGEGIRTTVIQGHCYMRGALHRRGCTFKTASEKEISSTRMEKRTSRGLGTGGRICINTGIRDFELGPDLCGGDLGGRGPGREPGSEELGGPRTICFVQTQRLSSCLKVGPISKHKNILCIYLPLPCTPRVNSGCI